MALIYSYISFSCQVKSIYSNHTLVQTSTRWIPFFKEFLESKIFLKLLPFTGTYQRSRQWNVCMVNKNDFFNHKLKGNLRLEFQAMKNKLFLQRGECFFINLEVEIVQSRWKLMDIKDITRGWKQILFLCKYSLKTVPMCSMTPIGRDPVCIFARHSSVSRISYPTETKDEDYQCE